MLETIGGWGFQDKHVRGVENFLADGTTRWKESEINTRLTAEHLTVLWQAETLGVEGKEMSTETVRVATHSDGLRGRLERLMHKVGGCGSAGGSCGER